MKKYQGRAQWWRRWYFSEYSYRLGKYMVWGLPKAEGVVLDLIHFLAQMNVGKKPNPYKQKPTKKSPNKNQAIKHNNKHTC